MGQRGLLVVQMGGEYRVAQYFQWISPEKTGVRTLQFLRDLVAHGRLDAFRERVARCRYLTEPEVRAGEDDVGVVSGYDLRGHEFRGFTTEQWERFKAMPMFRYLGLDATEFLRTIHDSDDQVVYLNDGLDFAGDGVFCEHAFVVDLDAEAFEVYVPPGPMERAAPGERFAAFPPPPEGAEHGPIRCEGTYLLRDLPTDDAFLQRHASYWWSMYGPEALAAEAARVLQEEAERDEFVERWLEFQAAHSIRARRTRSPRT